MKKDSIMFAVREWVGWYLIKPFWEAVFLGMRLKVSAGVTTPKKSGMNAQTHISNIDKHSQTTISFGTKKKNDKNISKCAIFKSHIRKHIYIDKHSNTYTNINKHCQISNILVTNKNQTFTITNK